MHRSRGARVAVVAAVVVACAAVAMLLFGTGAGGYDVRARFANAGQLVKGNPVQSGGVSIGSVSRIRVTHDGQAEITLTIEDEHAPLPLGTRAAIRQFSVSGIANRYVDLSFPSHGPERDIRDGGAIPTDATRTQVDLDQVLNAVDRPTRKALQDVISGTAHSLEDRGEQVGRGLEHLNPAMSASSRLFGELTRDRAGLEALLVESSQLVTALAARRDHVAALVGDLRRTNGALARRKTDLAAALELLPPFLRRSNTSFVNLRGALDDLDPLVRASRPLARELRPFLAESRGLARAAVPTVRDLRIALRRPGRSNDLTEYVRSFPPLAEIAVVTKERTLAPGGRDVAVGNAPGALPQTADALAGATPVIGLARPYTTDFLGWLDDFSTTGAFFDALGAGARAHLSFAENIYGAPPKTGQFRRCPGGADVVAADRSNLLGSQEQEELGCTEQHRALR